MHILQGVFSLTQCACSAGSSLFRNLRETFNQAIAELARSAEDHVVAGGSKRVLAASVRNKPQQPLRHAGKRFWRPGKLRLIFAERARLHPL